MGILKEGNIQKLERQELNEIYNFICSEGRKKQLLILGESGNGKTQMLHDVMNKVHATPGLGDYVYLHFDAKLFDAECSREALYNMLIYLALQPKEFNNSDHTQLVQGETFLEFLEVKNFKDDIKKNIKKTLIASLALIPQIGNLIYNILNVSGDDTKQQYVDNQLYFFQYLKYITEKSGCIIIIDNIQNIPSDMLVQFYNHISHIDSNIILLVSYTVNSDKMITHQDIRSHKCFDNFQSVVLKSFTKNEFIEICEKNFDYSVLAKILLKGDFYYSLTQGGNLRQIDEFFFRIDNYGLDNVTDTPTLQSVYNLDEIKKDILHLTSIFAHGIRQPFIEKIVRQHCSCSKEEIIMSIASLCNNNYIIETDNNIFKIEHEKISEASRKIIEIPIEEERFVELIAVCERIFTEEVYRDIEDADFIFCVNAIIDIVKKFNLLKHMGIISKYITLLHSSCYYSQICNMYSKLDEIQFEAGIETILLFPLITILHILDAHQKTSEFFKGLEIVNSVNKYYNVNLYHAKFLLQTYNYTEALNVLSGKKDNYEAWSIYLNTLQHLRKDDTVYNEVCNIIDTKFKFEDIEYYYVILRNSGHLFEPSIARKNISSAFEYFQEKNNEFAMATCYNNLGLTYLYENSYDIKSISEARKHFNNAKSIMHRLSSNEEYQSLFNIGLSYTCEKNYSVAINFYKKAKKLIKDGLSFDIYKLNCNIILCRFLNNEIGIDECRDSLLDNYVDIENVPDKWLKLQYDFNLHTLDNFDDKKNVMREYPYYTGNMELYGLYLDITHGDSINRFLFAPSPHWRY